MYNMFSASKYRLSSYSTANMNQVIHPHGMIIQTMHFISRDALYQATTNH